MRWSPLMGPHLKVGSGLRSDTESSDCESLPDIDEVETYTHKPVLRPLIKPVAAVPVLSINVQNRKRKILDKDVENNKDLVVAREILNETTAEANPLHIDLVLKQMMSYLPLKDLKKCRTICKKWYRHANECFKKIHPLVSFGSQTEFHDFVQQMKWTKDFHFSQFRIDSNCEPEDVELFFRRFGKYLKRLVLSCQANIRSRDCRRSQPFTRKNFEVMLSEIGNIEHLELDSLPRELTTGLLFYDGWSLGQEEHLLKLRSLRIRGTEKLSYGVTFSRDLFSIMPNCGKIHFDLSVYCPLTTSRFLTAMKEFRDRTTLAEVLISHPMQNLTLKVFIETGIRVKRLCLDSIELTVDGAESLRILLENQSGTIESLRLCAVGWGPFETREEMPVMSQLKQLFLYFPLHTQVDGNERVFPLTQNPTVNQFPCLQTLRLSNDVFSSFFKNSETAYSTVEFLDISTVESEEACRIRSIATIFPGLKGLGIALSSVHSGPGISTLFETMDRLQSLRLVYYGSQDINTLLTLSGMSTGSMTIDRDGEFSIYADRIVAKHMASINSKSRYSVRNMKRLTSLSITSTANKINDVSAYFGFLHMPALASLELCNVTMSPRTVCKLQAAHRNVHISYFI